MTDIKSHHRRVIVTVAVTIVTIGALNGCFKTVQPDVSMDATAAASLKSFDYSDWEFVTRAYVDGKGKVAYGKLKAERKRLDRFVALLGMIGPKTHPKLFREREAQLAYYINAYNALTLFNVINRYPKLKSVNDESKNFFYFTEFRLERRSISLYNLENEVIRPTFGDARIHFVLNCASAGCPVLPAEPFLPQTLEKQLGRETAKFLHEQRNVELDDKGAVTLSSIFKWYAEDFKPTPLAWIRSQAADLKLPAKAKIKHRPYDWALNIQKK